MVEPTTLAHLIAEARGYLAGYAYDAVERATFRAVVDQLDRIVTGEERWRQAHAGDPACQPEGTVEALASCATMLENWMPDCFPANGQGQVHFARCMTDAVAAEIRAFLSRQSTGASA